MRDEERALRERYGQSVGGGRAEREAQESPVGVCLSGSAWNQPARRSELLDDDDDSELLPVLVLVPVGSVFACSSAK